MATAVDIFLKDDSNSPSPIQSAIVSVYDPDTMALVSQATSDSNGRAAFSLPGAADPGTSYEVRVFKLGVIFANPFMIAVLEGAGEENQFDLSGTLLTLPAATDPRVCRCTGKFSGFSNTGLPNISLRVSALVPSGTQSPKVVDGNMIASDSTVYYTDADGFVTVDLLRGGQYYVTFSGEEDAVWPITVPDRSSVNLVDLIHPVPISLTWNQDDAPSNTISVAVGEYKTVRYSALLTDYREVGTDNNLDSVIKIWNSNADVMDVAAGDALIVVFGKLAGSGYVTATIVGTLTPIVLPTPTLVVAPLSVTVTA